MTTLTVVLDQLVASVPGGIGRYTRELTRHLVSAAPATWEVRGLVSLVPRRVADGLERDIPGISGIRRLPVDRRILARAWAAGMPPDGTGGGIHGMSLLTPMHERRRRRGLVATTIHDVVPWTHPETLTPRGVAWHRAMADRAHRFADAVVVPTRAVADQLAALYDFGDRVHVIPGAPSPGLALPDDHLARAVAMALPDRFVLAVGTLEPRKGLRHLIAAFADPRMPPVPLLIAGPGGWGDVDVAALARGAGVESGRIRVLGQVTEGDLAVLYDRASAFVMPSLAEGFGLPIVEAFSHGAPVIHSDAPALVEVAGGAGLSVPLGDLSDYPARLASAMAEVMGDAALRSDLAERGRARARAFDWTDSASRVWALHTGTTS